MELSLPQNFGDVPIIIAMHKVIIMVLIWPIHILLNFVNYMSESDLGGLLDKLPEVTHLGYGKLMDDVREI